MPIISLSDLPNRKFPADSTDFMNCVFVVLPSLISSILYDGRMRLQKVSNILLCEKKSREECSTHMIREWEVNERCSGRGQRYSLRCQSQVITTLLSWTESYNPPDKDWLIRGESPVIVSEYRTSVGSQESHDLMC